MYFCGGGGGGGGECVSLDGGISERVDIFLWG